MHILLTGSSGFVGTAIAQQCEIAGLPLRKTDRVVPAGRADHVQADILDPATLPPALAGISCVIHAAGLAHQFGKRQQTAPFMAVNAEGTANMAQATAAAGVQHFILISSVSVYGTHSAGACTEETPCQPEGIYATSKYQGEQQAIEIARASGMRLSILRLATVYGEGDPGNVARLMDTIDRGRFIWLGNGSNHKSLVHREDVARACLTAAQSAGSGIAIYNISAPPCRMREVVETLADALGRTLPRWQVPALPLLRLSELASRMSGQRTPIARLHDTLRKWLKDDVYDASAFQQATGFQTTVSLHAGLQREVAWYRSQQ
jgi:nucleoside-diphosphate-sugar epimerase